MKSRNQQTLVSNCQQKEKEAKRKRVECDLYSLLYTLNNMVI